MAQSYVKASDLPQVIPVFPLAGVIVLPRGQLQGLAACSMYKIFLPYMGRTQPMYCWPVSCRDHVVFARQLFCHMEETHEQKVSAYSVGQ